MLLSCTMAMPFDKSAKTQEGGTVSASTGELDTACNTLAHCGGLTGEAGMLAGMDASGLRVQLCEHAHSNPAAQHSVRRS
jgi:hypothetical protein